MSGSVSDQGGYRRLNNNTLNGRPRIKLTLVINFAGLSFPSFKKDRKPDIHVRTQRIDYRRDMDQGRQSWGSRPPDFGRGVVEGRRWVLDRSWNIYLIMYRKYVWKWWLFKRNRIICQIFAWKIEFFLNCLKRSKFFGNFPGKLEIVFWNCLKKIEIFRKFDCKNRFFLLGSTIPRFQTGLTPLTWTDKEKDKKVTNDYVL